MKIAAISLLVLSIFLSMVLLTSIDLFRELGEDLRPLNLTESRLMTGEYLPIYVSTGLWEKFPIIPLDIPSLLTSCNRPSFTLTSLLILVGFVILRMKWRRSYLSLGFYCLILSPIPYVCGRIALLTSTHVPSEVGCWLAFMICGMLYATGYCGLFAGLHLWSMHTDALIEFLVRPFKRFRPVKV